MVFVFEQELSSKHFSLLLALCTLSFLCVCLCVCVDMRAEEGHILNNTVLDCNGAGASLNVTIDYMFSQAASTALSGENGPNSFQGKPFIFFVLCNRAASNSLH